MYGVYCGGTTPGMRAVKSDGWKLIKYDVLDGKVRETQLFNLRENPHEFLIQHQAAEVAELVQHRPAAHQRNLADEPAHAQKRKEMESLLQQEMKRLGDPYRLAD
jgi:choline-sulfatase